jgi:hypothetical protein
MPEYADAFDLMVPRDVQVDLMQMLVMPYQVSANTGLQYPEGTRKKYQPQLLHADVEIAFRGIAARHPGVVELEECRARNNSYHYVRLRVDRVLITVSAVGAPLEMPRDADHRETMSRIQWELFGANPESADRWLYAILLHGHDGQDTSQPNFATVAFPDAYYNAFVDHIPLFKRYAEELQTSLGVRPEDVDDIGRVLRRRHRKIEDGPESA